MEIAFSALFIATIAFKLTSAEHIFPVLKSQQFPVDNGTHSLSRSSNLTIGERYQRLIKKYEEIESKYKNLPDEREQLHSINAHSILRLSAHLKNNFEKLKEQVLQRICSNSNCHGSAAYQKEVTKICLFADIHALYQLQSHKQFTECCDDVLINAVHNREIGSINMRELDLNIEHLKAEYRDVNNRFELKMVLDYYETIINENIRILLDVSVRIEEINADLETSLSICSPNGFPRMSKTIFEISSVKRCIKDFLLIESQIIVQTTFDDYIQRLQRFPTPHSTVPLAISTGLPGPSSS